MPSKSRTIRHFFLGGWATDYGPTVDVLPDQTGKVGIPFLVDAENVLFELDGGPHKIGGTTKLNSSAVASSAAVMGLYDYWKSGTAGAPARRRVLHAGTLCMNDADDGTFVNLFTGLESGSVPCYSTFDDLLIISSNSTTDVPRSWDQTTAQNLAGSPPRFSISCTHKNRSWAAGVHTVPSRLYYSANVDPEDWTGVGSGSIDIDPNDGDTITGIVSHQNKLFIFKGPNKGSIHMITGSSPTGSDAFARTTFVQGIGAAAHNSIFRFSDDIGFVSQFGTISSLSATQAYGDFASASLSRPINIGWIRSHLNYNRLKNISAATDSTNGLVYITASWDANSVNNTVLVMDYRNAPDIIRWSKIPSYSCASLAAFVDTNGVRRVLAGGNDGFVRRLNIADRSIDAATSIAYKITTPFLNYGDPFQMKTLEQASVGIAPKGDYDFTYGWTRDNNAQQTFTQNQGGEDVLGPANANEFTLDTSALGGSKYVDRYMELAEGGEFRSIQYQVTNSGTNEDMEVHSISAVISGGSQSTENA